MVHLSPEMKITLPRFLGDWMKEHPGRPLAGSVLLFGTWEIISSLLLAETKLYLAKSLVALALLRLAWTAKVRAVAMLITAFVLLTFFYLNRVVRI